MPQKPWQRWIVFLRWLFGFVAIGVPIVILEFGAVPKGLLDQVDVARLWAWIASLAGMLGLFVQAGLELKGRVLGVLIDERNKYSLSRLQMTLWTVLIVASLYVVLLSNVIRGAGVKEALNVNLDWNLIVLLGISAASFVTSPLILSRKANQLPDVGTALDMSRELTQEQQLAQPPGVNGNVVVKQSPADARASDLIRGEEVGNATVVDISRTQMLLITLAVVVVYGGLMAQIIAGSFAIVQGLPELHQTLLGLILVSHAGYVTGKITPTAQGTSTGGAEHLARALLLSQRATQLVRDLETKSASALPGVAGAALRQTIGLARTLAAQASALPTRVTAADFKVEELAAVEGRMEALSSAFTAMVGEGARSEPGGGAPSPNKVLEVQRKLRAQGFPEVNDTGVPDARTEHAIRTLLIKIGVDRRDLHPQPYRYYEEVAELI